MIVDRLAEPEMQRRHVKGTHGQTRYWCAGGRSVGGRRSAVAAVVAY